MRPVQVGCPEGGRVARKGAGWPECQASAEFPSIAEPVRAFRASLASPPSYHTVMQAYPAPYGVTGSVCPNRLAKPNRLLDHLRGIALGSRNLQNYVHHSLLDTGGFQLHLQPLP